MVEHGIVGVDHHHHHHSTHDDKTKVISPPPRKTRWKEMIICDITLLVSFLAYSYLQERIMTIKYQQTSLINDDKEETSQRFKYSLMLVLVNRLMASLAAICTLLLKGMGEEIPMKASFYEYMIISFSNVCATSSQYEALKWVTLPTQTLVKGAKTIPVMVWGTLMSGKVYTMMEYAAAAVIAIGCAVFMLSGSITAKMSAPEDSWFGLVLMLLYLIFDGFTSTYQEKLFHGYSMSIYNQMLYVNLCSSVISMVLLIVTGQFLHAVLFIKAFPGVIYDMCGISLAAVVGQFAIHYMIKEFGALRYATVMAVRQFLAVFVSNIVFGHGLNISQLTGAVAVFVALMYKSRAKRLAGR
eukprot:Plantae.Rhodophyta-Hildenbrandia_rubra.ctg14384.p1 GENE.Plantae.Rhodophyta-Hildenbrandia_rubra.ctg14384~~Plantae.Rhodophyta-Hildenbrandia_rubra.ctg14384.p1  ORF type:complete len:355 (+),score=36.51 Plantae.Rhodophyta-Hildenbrandia_rubra.ctg14384:569-1633(+)